MPCCGQQRQAIRNRTSAVMRPGAPRNHHRTRALFRYLGTTALKVRGPASGRLYRFDLAHPIVEIDPRDAPSLAHVPHLQQVPSP